MKTLKQTLSLRLATLKSFRTSEEVVWDIGCDHGDLGLSFVNSDVKEINLVDPSEAVINGLQNKLRGAGSYITKQPLYIHHKRGQDLVLKTKNNIIFIAGMGGEEIGDIIQALLPQLDDLSKIVISPHRKILELRNLLNQKNVSLVHEECLLEDNQFYQFLVLKKGEGAKVSLYGNEIWASEVGKQYLAHQIFHFDRHQAPESRSYVEYLKTLK